MRAKAWLFSQGHIAKDGRGRMPSVSIRTGESITGILDNALKSGVSLEDWPRDKANDSKPAKSAKPTKPAKAKTKASVTKPQDSGVVELAPYRYTEEEFEAVEIATGHKRSLREACNNCRVSLVVCWCEEPRIVANNGRPGSVKVRITRRAG